LDLDVDLRWIQLQLLFQTIGFLGHSISIAQLFDDIFRNHSRLILVDLGQLILVRFAVALE
jgi:hypothetical protein